MEDEQVKPAAVKIIQLVSNTIPRPANPNTMQAGGFSVVIYGLGDDGNLYFFNHKKHVWVAA